MFAEICPVYPSLGQSFHYTIPENLTVEAGHLVEVEFGQQRVQGIVVTLSDEAPAGVTYFKPILSLIDAHPVLTHAQLDLGYYLAHHTLAPLAECLTLMLPPGLAKQGDLEYTLRDETYEAQNENQIQLLKLLRERGALRGKQLERALPKRNWRGAMTTLVKKNIVSKRAVLQPPSVRPKIIRTARLLTPHIDDALFELKYAPFYADLLEKLFRLAPAQPTLTDLKLTLTQLQPLLIRGWVKFDQERLALTLESKALQKMIMTLRTPNKRARVIDFLARQDRPIPVSWVYADTGADAATLKDLAERGYVDLGEEETLRDPLAHETFVAVEPPTLTEDQEKVWREIEFAIQHSPLAPKPFLLHGVTGSGKTEIYLRAVAAALEKKLRALVLVPEIALTPQTVRRFASRFPNRVTVIHSELSEGQRYDMWRRARAGAVDVIVGPRSALFAPLPKVGLIIVDEEHDESYYNNSTPHYHAREAAVAYAQRLNAVCLMGSATPDLVSYARAQKSEYRLIELPQRIMAHGAYLAQQAERLNLTAQYHAVNETAQYIDLPNVSVVDMRQELRAGNVAMFSRALQTALSEVLSAGEQAILFLNRRGTATHVCCRDCGYVVECVNCGTPLTYHGDENQLQCHHCGITRRKPAHCPKCKGARIKFFGAGTERVLSEVERFFPEARAVRWDRDTTRVKGTHDLILNQFRQRQADILIGTQMIAKGLDLPLVTLVGVVSADIGLNMPDYRASERVFQVLTQVAGRAGRSLLGGRVILQTYEPEHYVIQAASQHDFKNFYQQEITLRRQYSYPPFGKLVRLVYKSRRNDQAETEARRVADLIRKRMKDQEATNTTLIGPAPCFFDRLESEYRWQIILRGANPAPLVPKENVRGWVVEVEPLSLL